ncbi:cell division cycle protein-like protein [Myriangium duriaei CBS 260.36]|uniref:Cell division cycle protein-like protein n=1 Tax=Myriangium duriaei CBS 260.36 TaxID=1168546 RepID=A0A9P4J721_9PEZI|nr:cell division cycle protein-like protein [Myriangium duriaei CBS 260.36]
MEQFLRTWRQDALEKHQYESAIFIGDKLLALTNDDKDAFWLAQVHFSTGNYKRALGFLARQDLISRNPSCKYLAAHCYVKQQRFEDALNVLGDKNPTHLFAPVDRARRKLQHVDPRNGAGKLGKAPQRTDRIDRSEDRDNEDPADLKFEAGMCYLRGLCYAKQNAIDRAKSCYKDAVRIDVQCFEAFDQLMSNKLMSPHEEWEFLESLDFDNILNEDGLPDQEASDFTKMLYVTRMSKYGRPDDFTAAVETLSSHYNLAANPSLLLARAELLFTNCRFKQSLELTTSILENDPYNFEAIPVHIACLEAEGETNALFLLSHDLADTHPDEPATWLAVGTYYMAINQISQARAYFSKSSLMDPHFGPAWIGFAHTFAAEGEHDQAISAYSTAARLFQGTHLPQLFLGMQNLSLGNTSLARDYFNTAYNMCNTDPLLLNDLGVTNYQEGLLDQAIRCFQLALKYADEVESSPTSWLNTRNNLGHAYRRNGQLAEALDEFDAVLRHGTQDAAVFVSKGLVLLELEQYLDATAVLHEALAVSPQDPMATDLLARALDSLELEDPARIAMGVKRPSRRRRKAGLHMDMDEESVLDQSRFTDVG